MSELDFYRFVISDVTSLMKQFHVILTCTMHVNPEHSLHSLYVNLVYPTMPTNNQISVCENNASTVQQDILIARLAGLQTHLEKVRDENIKHGLNVALLHMKSDSLQALQQLAPSDLFDLVQSELNRRFTK